MSENESNSGAIAESKKTYRFYGPTEKSPGKWRYVTAPYKVIVRDNEELGYLIWLFAPYMVKRVS